jgi:hypothetical protein
LITDRHFWGLKSSAFFLYILTYNHIIWPNIGNTRKQKYIEFAQGIATYCLILKIYKPFLAFQWLYSRIETLCTNSLLVYYGGVFCPPLLIKVNNQAAGCLSVWPCWPVLKIRQIK